MILNALAAGKPLPVYGNSQQIRDWLWRKMCPCVVSRGDERRSGRKRISAVVTGVKSGCGRDDLRSAGKAGPAKAPPRGVANYHDHVTFVTTIDGHDLRYAIDASKIARELGWTPQETFEVGCEKPFNGISPMRLVETRAGWQLSGRTLRSETLNGQVLTHGGRADERHHSGGRFRYPVASHYARRIKSASARLRQADDLLSVIGANAGGHS